MHFNLTHIHPAKLAGAIVLPCVILGLASCQPASNGSSTVAPQSMDGLTLDILSFDGPSIGFTASRQQSSDGFEEGSILLYTQNPGAEGFLFPGTQFVFDDDGTPTVSNLFNGHPVKWPDEFNDAQYRYRAVGEASGRLEIFGTGVSNFATRVDIDGNVDFIFTFVFAESFLGEVTSADPLVFDVLFSSSGSTITGLNLVMTTPKTIDLNPLIGIEEQELALDGDITFTDGARVNVGYDPDLGGDFVSLLFDGILDNKELTLTDDLTGTSSLYIFDTSLTTGGFDRDVTDSGTFTLTFDLNGDPTFDNETGSGRYEVEPIKNTDSFIVDLNFENSDLLNSGNVQDGNLTLDFSDKTYTRITLDTETSIQSTVTGTFAIDDVSL